jgi:hypothetical protein
MKQILLTINFLIISLSLMGQSVIDSSNYCSFYNMKAHYANSKISTSYLNDLEIAKIVMEEMKSLGFQHVSNYQIVKIDSINYINAICFSEKSNIGFLYEGICGMIPEQKNRYVISLYKEMTGYAYAEKILGIDGESQFLKITDLPKNLHILKMENYWYQESTDTELKKNLVSKEFIIELLRQDIRRITPLLINTHNSK